MAGVNLNEENARILATSSELVGTKILRQALPAPGCCTLPILDTGLLCLPVSCLLCPCPMSPVLSPSISYPLCPSCPMPRVLSSPYLPVSEVLTSILLPILVPGFLVCYNVSPLLRQDEEHHEPSSDVRSQLRFFEQLERMEKQRKDDQEREILLKAAKSRARQEDPEQARLKQKAKEMQQQELAQIRQRDANLTALAAIGPRKKRKMGSPGGAASGTEVASGSAAGSPAAAASASSSRQQLRQRITRVNLRDFIFCLEQERCTARSLTLYKALLK
ncbi:transcription initiation factor TFIID subunit 4-like [Perca fluviatilis]|uniref:transcription initiation factor TFIID subunit 4-like n=1 Tax=Perca fluviatilis TaxID=8168 RepID=UPI0019640943|nr:transcription initiation factor TFIID subunit 4-like [Perca fluviatilis]